MSNGSSATPIAERAWRPASPQRSRMRSLKPLITAGIRLKPRSAVDEAQRLGPALRPVEVAELLLERGEHRERRRAGGCIGLLDANLCAHLAAEGRPEAIEWAMARDVRDVTDDADELESDLHARRRGEHRGQRQAELGKAGLDEGHRRSVVPRGQQGSTLVVQQPMGWA